MCKLPAIIVRIVAGAGCLLLSSCFDIHEEVWIAADGSGRAELVYSVPSSAVKLAGGKDALELKIREAIAAQPELRLDRLEVLTDGKRSAVEVTLSTGSVYSLRNLDEKNERRDLPAAAVDLAGKFDVRLSGLNVDFSRTVRVREALGLAALAIRESDREQRRLRYVVHLPAPALESNATETAEGGRTLVWESSLGEALRTPVITRFKARLPIPRAVWFASALVTTALTGLIFWLRAARRKRPLPATPR